MYISSVLAERILDLLNDSGASSDEQFTALQIATTLKMAHERRVKAAPADADVLSPRERPAND